MKLLLTSSGLKNESIINALKELLGRPTTDCRFVFIPTAMHPERGDKDWVLRDMNMAFALGWKHFDIIDLAAVAALEAHHWLPGIEQADVIMVGGGNTFFLSYWMQKTGLMAKLPELLKDKVYIGSSAGSMLVGHDYKVTLEGEILHDTDYEEKSPKGFGSDKMAALVPFTMRPHLNSRSCPNITHEHLTELAKEVKTPMYGMDDQTAIQVVDGEVTVISEGEWHLYNG